MATTRMPPFVLEYQIVDSPNDVGNLRYDGIEMKILKSIARKMQFTMNFE